MSPRQPRDGEGGDEPLFDYGVLAHWAGFALRSVRRNLVLAVACFALVLGVVGLAARVLPWKYHVHVVIQALRNPSLPTLANAGLYRPYEADAPTRAARETVLRRDNLLALIQQTNLLERWETQRAPAVRFVDAVRKRIRGRERTVEERVDQLIERLEKRVAVDVSEGIVTIAVDWPDAATALQLAEHATENFLETRHTTEIAIVRDAIAILEGHAASVKRELDDGVRGLDVLERVARARERRRAPVPAAAPAPVEPAPDLEPLQARLAAKRRALADLEDLRQRRIAELQAQLAQLQTVYAEKHPALLSVQQNIDAMAGPSPQIDRLRAEVQELERDIIQRGGIPKAASATPVLLGGMREGGMATLTIRPGSDDPRLEYERNRVRLLTHNYSSIVERIEAAQVEMEAARAAFKYRYSVISPPQLPKKPASPKPLVVAVGGLLSAVMLSVLAALARDVRRGTVLEGWQLEQLGVPLLGEVRR